MELDHRLILGLAAGITASVLLNVGKGVQKQKVEVLKKGWQMFAPIHRRNFLIWLVGISMTVAASVFYSLSLKLTDKSSLVASLNGVGLIGLVLYAWLVLKERVGAREVFSSLLIIAGTGTISYFNQPLSAAQHYQLANFIYTGSALLIFFAAIAVAGLKFPKFYGFSFGLIAGSLIGLAMILGDMALVKSQGNFFGQFKNVYLYLAMLSATSALILTQVAFLKGTAMLVVPTINSFIILTPLLAEYFTFGTRLDAIQYLGVAVIVTGVIILTTSPRQSFQAAK